MPLYPPSGASGPPEAHKTSHENGGTDEISVAGLSGTLADTQPPIIGAGAAQAVAGNDARLTDARTPNLTATTDNFIVAVASAWASRTPAQVKTTLTINNVDNTTDAGKPVSTAQQTALDLKANLAGPTFTGTVTVPGLTINNATDLTINATTGTKIGQSTSKIGFFGVTPAVRPTAITQTYSTASSTHAAVTQLAAPAGGTGATAGAYNTAANRDLMITSINAARTDIANVKQVLNQVIDQLQALGLLQ